MSHSDKMALVIALPSILAIFLLFIGAMLRANYQDDYRGLPGHH